LNIFEPWAGRICGTDLAKLYGFTPGRLLSIAPFTKGRGDNLMIARFGFSILVLTLVTAFSTAGLVRGQETAPAAPATPPPAPASPSAPAATAPAPAEGEKKMDGEKEKKGKKGKKSGKGKKKHKKNG
jgi:hypothetical protein